MIKYTPSSEIKLSLFKTPFDQQLDPQNRWVKWEQVIPWDNLASVFRKSLSENMGRSTIDLRVVLGVLIIQIMQKLSDREVIAYVQENIYAQYFVGLPSFTIKEVFDPSLLVLIRKRLGEQGAHTLNELLIEHALAQKAIRHKVKRKSGKKNDKDPGMKGGTTEGGEANSTPKQDKEPKNPNRGTIKIDATVCPQNIAFPTDTSLLNKARLKQEQIIDKLFEAHGLWKAKPRTYRRIAKKKFLNFSKKRSPSTKKIRQQRKAQLGYVRRNLRYINEMLDLIESKGLVAELSRRDWHYLRVIHELYQQQNQMYIQKSQQINDRIVSLEQPWVRPIKRGKAKAAVEFGAKINISLTEGFTRVEQGSYNAYNEGKYLREAIEAYRSSYGYYPELALVDKIYLTRENRNWLKNKGIRHAGVPLGRPPKMDKALKKTRKKEQSQRNLIEGKIGEGKNNYGWNKIKTKLPETSLCTINLIALVMNIVKLGKALSLWLKSKQIWRIFSSHHLHFYQIDIAPLILTPRHLTLEFKNAKYPKIYRSDN